MSEEEFLPKWYASSEPKNKVAENIIAITLIVLLTIFTLGIVSAFQHTGDTLKGRD
jgi:amino acid transporter